MTLLDCHCCGISVVRDTTRCDCRLQFVAESTIYQTVTAFNVVQEVLPVRSTPEPTFNARPLSASYDVTISGKPYARAIW